MVLVFGLGICSAESLKDHLHEKASLGPDLPSEAFRSAEHKPIPPREAAAFAVSRLKARGVGGILICELHWIAAPVSGYLIDALGRATLNDSTFSTFRIGIRDGLEERHGLDAGEEFVFIAHGVEEGGRPVWYPSPGPDRELGLDEAPTDEMLAYEFLLWRVRFETLRTRYP